MVRYRGQAIFAALCIMLASAGVSADSGVLLPSSSDSGSQPNLGLVPSSSGTSQQSTPAAPHTSAPAPVQPPAAAPAPVAQASQAAPVTPPYSATTKTVNTYSISVSLARDSTHLTPMDVETIYEQLGLPKSQVARSCRIGFNGMIITTTGTHSIDSDMTTSAVVGYSGGLTNSMISIYVACESAPKPAPYSYMQRIGSYYGISLGTAYCDTGKPITGNKSTLIVSRGKNGTGTCRYE